MKILKISGSVLIALCIAASAYAHHSAAGIDQTKTVTAEGVVKEFKWANPHSWLEIEVQNSKGVPEIWNLEMNPPTYLVRAGWKSTTVKPGDKVKFSARPFKNGDPGGLFVSVTLPDGKVLGQTAPRGNGPAAPVYEQK
jgi:Family of unknown function (DUF6152)